jgi:hypothetical protein
MLGGFNKIMRNIVAGATDTEFEKVSPHSLHPTIFTETNERHFSFGQQRAQREARDL